MRAKNADPLGFEAEYAAELAAAERKYGPRGRRKTAIRDASAQSLAAYESLRTRLASDTAFVAALDVCAAWAFGTPTAAASAAVGGAGAMAYVFLLTRGVDKIADGARAGGGGGDGQAARILVLVVLVALVGKSGGRLTMIPAILGFFSYKVAVILPLISGEAFED